MFTGNEIGGSKSNQVEQGVPGHDQTAAESASEVVPFEHRLMTKREISVYFGITERTIEVWMRRRYIPFMKIGQTVRFRVSTVIRYVDDKYSVPAAGRLQR